MPHWSDPLLALLAEQPPDTTTLTLSLAEVTALVGTSLPPSAKARGYWHARGPKAMGQRLRAVGWWVAQVECRGTATMITFMRYELTPWATRRWRNGS